MKYDVGDGLGISLGWLVKNLNQYPYPDGRLGDKLVTVLNLTGLPSWATFNTYYYGPVHSSLAVS